MSLNPKHGEMLEPHLWTNQIEDFAKTKNLKARPTPLLFQYSLKQFTRHRAEMLGSSRRIAGDASADLMYRVAVRKMGETSINHFFFVCDALFMMCVEVSLLVGSSI